jgi:NAD(P)H-hydrate epimerase
MGDIPDFTGTLPYLSTEQMKEVDRKMIEDFGIQLIQMMENAGRNLAHLANILFLERNPQNKLVAVLAGPGGNGGGALVCARHLHNFGASVKIILSTHPTNFAPIPAQQLRILQNLDIPIFRFNNFDGTIAPNLTIDGMIGYNLKGHPRAATAELINWANSKSAPTLALDVPSGIDATTGIVYKPAIKAAATMTLALPKKCFLVADANNHIGELYLADISVPPALYRASPLNLDVHNIFAQSEIVRLKS